MSVRASASLPSSCSGAMYWKVPRIVPSCVTTVLRRQRRQARLRRRRRHRLGEPEVEELHPRLRDHHVCRLEIPVHDPLPMRFVQRVCDLHAVTQRLLKRQRTLGQPIRERLALEVLHDEVLDVALASDVIEGTICGCESCEIVFASRSNRCRTSGEEERRCGSTFTATVRSSRVSFAL